MKGKLWKKRNPGRLAPAGVAVRSAGRSGPPTDVERRSGLDRCLVHLRSERGVERLDIHDGRHYPAECKTPQEVRDCGVARGPRSGSGAGRQFPDLRAARVTRARARRARRPARSRAGSGPATGAGRSRADRRRPCRYPKPYRPDSPRRAPAGRCRRGRPAGAGFARISPAFTRVLLDRPPGRPPRSSRTSPVRWPSWFPRTHVPSGSRRGPRARSGSRRRRC